MKTKTKTANRKGVLHTPNTETKSVMEAIVDHLMNAEHLLKDERYQGTSQERYEMLHNAYEQVSDTRLELMGLL
jgi:ABC-type transporter lipoprotein component MlaA